MKTPMSMEIIESWSLPEAPKHVLTISGLLEEQRRLGRTIGLIIDLSNHDTLCAWAHQHRWHASLWEVYLRSCLVLHGATTVHGILSQTRSA